MTLNEIVNVEGLERKRKNLGITFDGVFYHSLAQARIDDGIKSAAYEWCQENFNDDWIWSRPSMSADYIDLYFLKSEDAFLFGLRFQTIPI